MTKNNSFRLLLLLLCLCTILTTMSSCDKDINKPVGNGWNAYVVPSAPDYWFSRVRYFKDHRTPATDTVWTLHLITADLVNQYVGQDGYIYAETSTYSDVGVLWIKK